MLMEDEREFGDENRDGADHLPHDLLLSCVRKNSKRQDGDSDEHYLGKVTHVNLSGKGLTQMSGKGLELCKKMQTLYLYENKLERLSPLNFARGLTHLYLQHNRLRSFRGLGTLPALTKLYADYNCIEVVAGLEGCPSLAELHLSHQQRAPAASTSEIEEKGLTFAPDTLRVLAESLQTLSIRGCTLEKSDVLGDMRALESIDASDSDVNDIVEIERILERLPNLTCLNLSGCPVAKTRKYRDRVVLAGISITELDGKPVRDDERLFLIKMRKNTLTKRMAQL